MSMTAWPGRLLLLEGVIELCPVCLRTCRVVTAAQIPATAKEQLELFSSHGVFVTVTGAGLGNALFLVPFSSVIEVFPPMLDQNLGPTVSIISGMGYYPVHTHNNSAMYQNYNVRPRVSCHLGCRI